MTKQERLDILAELTGRLDKIIQLLENKNKRREPLITFNKANPNADDSFIKEREKEIFNSLDYKE